MPALSQERELDELLAESRPETRYQDLAMYFRRLTVSSPVPIPDDTVLTAPDGTRLRVKNTPGGLACGSTPPGCSAHLADGTPLHWEGGEAELHAEVLARFGGRWDHLENRWAEEPPEAPLFIDCQESQVEIVRWFAGWFAKFSGQDRTPRERSCVIYSDRRAGKTWITWLLIFAAVLELPVLEGQEFVVWAVSVNYPEREELDRVLREVLPAGWFHMREQPRPVVRLVNGGTLHHISADDPETLKRGKADLVLINEAAKMDSRPFENAGPGTADRGGLVLATTNPPHLRCPKGFWVQELYEKWEEQRDAGRPLPMQFLTTTSRWNVAIDAGARSDWGEILAAVNPDQARADDEGQMTPRGNLAYRPPFDQKRHCKTFDSALWMPQDITRVVTKRLCGTAYDWIVGADFQHWPAMTAVACKVYGDPDEPTVWVHGDWWHERADEDALIDGLAYDEEYCEANPGAEPRFSQANTLWIGDCSGTWQDGAHRPGQSSFEVFRARKWRIEPVQKPKEDGKRPANPPVELSVGRVHTLLTERRLLIAPTARRIAIALKYCERRKGRYGFHPAGVHAHMTDALRYVIWWILPRRRAPKADMLYAARSRPAGRRGGLSEHM